MSGRDVNGSDGGRHLDDELRAAMRAEADRARPDPGAWPDVERRREERGRPAWRWGALAVAAVAVVAVIGVLAWPRDGRDEVIVVDSTGAATTVLPDVTVAPATSTAPETTAPPTTATTTVPPTTAEPAGRPGTAVAVTEDGRLVVLDVSGPEAVEVRELDRGPDPRIVPTEGETASLADPALSPDGRTVYYSLCCEPVVGVLFSAAVDGSSPPVNLGYGTFPAVSPTGDHLAIVQYDTIVVRDLATGEEQTFPDTAHPGTLLDLTWSEDGSSLFYVRDDNGVAQLVELTLTTGAMDVVLTSDVGLRFPLSGPGATLSVVEQCCAFGGDTAQAVVIFPRSGADEVEQLPLPLADRSGHGADELRVDAEHRIIWARSDPPGAIPADQTTLGAGYLDAAW